MNLEVSLDFVPCEIIHESKEVTERRRRCEPVAEIGLGEEEIVI